MKPGTDSQNHSWLSYCKSVLGEARQELLTITKKQAVWDALVIGTGAVVGFLLGEPAGNIGGIFAGAIAALGLVVLVVGAWCIAWAPVNILRFSLTENHALREKVRELQEQLNEESNRIATAVQALSRSGHLERFRIWGKEFIQGTSVLYSGFNNDGIRDLLMMKLIRPERIPNPPKPLEPLSPGEFRTGYTEPPFRTLYLFTDLGAEVWKRIQEDKSPEQTETESSDG